MAIIPAEIREDRFEGESEVDTGMRGPAEAPERHVPERKAVKSTAQAAQTLKEIEYDIRKDLENESSSIGFALAFVNSLISEIGAIYIDLAGRITKDEKLVFEIPADKVAEKEKLEKLAEKIKQRYIMHNFTVIHEKVKSELEQLFKKEQEALSDEIKQLSGNKRAGETAFTNQIGNMENALKELKGQTQKRDALLESLLNKLTILDYTITGKKVVAKIQKSEKKMAKRLEAGERKIEVFESNLGEIRKNLITLSNHLKEIQEFSLKISAYVEGFLNQSQRVKL